MSTGELETVSGVLRVGFLRRVVASVALIAAPACNGGDLVLPADGAPSAIALVEGDKQTGSVGAPLSDSLVVRVTDRFGNPVAATPVEWAVESGSVSPGSTTTGHDGLAATRRVLGSSVGTQTTVASSPELDGSTVTFTHTATPGTAASLVLISGNDQSAAAGTELPEPLVVRLVDEAGNGIPDRAVNWVLPTGDGTASPESGDTDSDGFASTRWTLDESPGPNRLTAVVSGVGVVEFVATGTGGGGGGDPTPSATRSTVTASPGSVPAVTGASTITVTVRDGQSRPISGATVTLAASGSGNELTQPGGTTGADGEATGTLRSSVPGTKVVTATVNGSVTIQQTATVTVTLVPVADHLVFRVQPSDVDERERIEPAVEVAVVDQNGNLFAESGIEIRLELVPDDGRLRGDRTRDTENGLAVFNDLEVHRDGEGYRLRASAPDLPGLGTAESEPFDVNGVKGD